MKNIIIGVIYRPPSEYTLEFLEKLNKLLSGVTKGNKYCYITGDFNLDLLKHESHSITAQFLEALFSYGFLPMITKPTRITAHSATLIDNIFTNNTTVSSKNGSVIVSDISDHLPIFSIVTAGRSPRVKNKNYITVRDMSEKRTEEFKTKLENTDWEFDKESGDPNASYDVFIEKFTGLFDSCFPFKIVRGKALNSFKKPWLTKALLKSINKKNKLYKQYLRNRRSDAQFLKYKKYKNKLTYLLRIAKKRYYETQIDKNKDNIKLTWKILNGLINRSKKKSLSYPQPHDNGQDITNPEEIANKFCQYFTSIGPNLASKIPPASKSFREFINRVPSKPLPNFAPVTPKELYEIVKNFKDGKAPGVDDIAISIVKKTVDVISDPLVSIINSSLSSGVFPDKLKISKIIPIHKSDDASLVQNYRPISILPALSKIFERAVYNRIVFQFLTDNNILFHHQFGFRPGHSTSHALINLVNKIATAVDSNKYLARVFLDLSKAFDTLDHDILLTKLEAYGITDTALKWITDYFRHRKQFVHINESKTLPGILISYYLLMIPVHSLSIMTHKLSLISLTTSFKMCQHG